MFGAFKYKNRLIKGFIVLFLFMILLYPTASFQGASSGLLLWFHTVLPTLLPFIILSNLMIRLNITRQISRFLYPIIGKLFRVSLDGCYPILIGFLSGIPMGAKTTADLLQKKEIPEKEGQFLLSMCNNASPMFIMSYIVISQLKLPRIKYSLFALLYCSSILSALIYRIISNLHNKKRMKVSGTVSLQSFEVQKYKAPQFQFDILDSAIMNGFEVVTKIGGYIILFSILAQLVNQIGSQTVMVKAILMGVLEITTGINQICSINIPLNAKIVLVAVLTSFGGLSGMAQTKSVLGDTRLSMKSYFVVKLLNAFLTFLFVLLYITFFYH